MKLCADNTNNDSCGTYSLKTQNIVHNHGFPNSNECLRIDYDRENFFKIVRDFMMVTVRAVHFLTTENQRHPQIAEVM